MRQSLAFLIYFGKKKRRKTTRTIYTSLIPCKRILHHFWDTQNATVSRFLDLRKKHLVWHFFPMSVAFFYSAVIKSSLELLLQNVEYNLSNIYYNYTAKQWIFDPRNLHETKTNCSGWFPFKKHVLNLSQNTCQRSFLVFLSKRDKRKNIYFSFRWTKASAW
jgi:hypothetical protein